jgi:hypothetical protein
MRNWPETARYARRDDVVVEVFPEAILAFQAMDCRLIHLNRTAMEVWTLLDGHRTLGDIARTLAGQYSLSPETVLQDLAEAASSLEVQRLIKPLNRIRSTERKQTMSSAPRYLANPDVLCRIEDDTGAILYNPDTDAVQVINPVGLEIWQTLSIPRESGEISAHLQTVCEGVPPEQVGQDVGDFLKALIAAGFVGETEHDDGR